MDGFILPPSESTCILKDNDIVSVKKKEGGLAIEGNHATNIAENNKTMEKQTVNTGPLLLANEEFEKESGGYKSEEPEDESEDEEGAAPVKGSSHPENLLGCNTKKRKAPEALPSSKKQKHCSEVAQKVDEQAKKSQQDLTSKKSFRKQKKVPDPDNKDVDNNKEGAESSKVNDSKSSMKNNKLQEYGVENVEATPMPEKVQKGPSRSSQRQYERRKVFKVIRKFVKEYSASESGGLANSGKRDDNLHPKRRFNGETGGRPKRPRNWKQQQDRSSNQEMSDQPKGLLHWKQEREEGKGGHANRQEQTKKSALCEKPGQDSSTEGEVVPAEIRPGHIRFEPLGKERVPLPSQVEPESFRFNGNISKRKGQKWGQEKVSFSHKNDSQYSNKEYPVMVNGERQEWGREEVPFPQTNDSLDSNKEHSEMVDSEKEPRFHESIDFNELPYLSGLPKEGHVIAYKLLELSSSWTPQISAYRVGNISFYDSEANIVFLIPVAEFPLILTEDESSEQPDNSIYNEDGSLEINFSSLLEVRLVKDGTPGRTGTPGQVIERSAANESAPMLGSINKKTETPAAGAREVNNGKQKTQSTPLENGVNLWDQFSDTLKAKKAELSKESSCDKENSGRSSWSYRSMRGSALGPTMAFLRSQKEI